ncbi:diguanylate cyclase [Shewanella sp. A3A]|nr:diguanylate cyclase [Shewanella ferrihydritica]
MLLPRSYPLRLVILLPFSLLLIAAATVFCVTSYHNSQNQALSMAHSFARELSLRISQYVSQLTQVMPAITEINSLELQNGNLSVEQPGQNTPWLLAQLRQHPQLSFVSIAYIDGRYIAAARPPDHAGKIEIASNIFNSQRVLEGFEPNATEHLGKMTGKIRGVYDPRQRPFMQCALAHPDTPCWGKVYRYLDSGNYGISLSRAVFNQQGEMLGVVAADIALNRLNEFMARLNMGFGGIALLTESDGTLLASSNPQQIAAVDNAGQRYQLSHHPAALLQALPQVTEQKQPHRFEVNGQGYLLEVRDIRLGSQLTWQLMVLVPEQNIAAPMMQQLRASLIWTAILFGLMILVGVILARKIARPIEKLARLASQNNLPKLAAHQVESTRFVEVSYLEYGLTMLAKAQLNSIQMLEQQVHNRTLALQEANQRLTMLSQQDPLTGIANRRAFSEQFAAIWHQALQQQQPLSMILCDVDFFKAFNDNFGHQAGDAALIAVAQHLRQHVPSEALLARYGGEEFAVVLPNTPLADAVDLADMMRRSLFAKAIARDDVPCGVVTLSLGVGSCLPSASNTVQQLIKQADELLYVAKAAGRNQVQPVLATLRA